MNNYFYRNYFVKKVVFVFLAFLAFFIIGAFAQLTGTGERPEDWGENNATMNELLVELLKYDENGNPYQGNNPNEQYIKNAKDAYVSYMNSSTTANIVYDITPNTKNEIIIPPTKTNNISIAKITNDINYPCTVITNFLARNSQGVNVYALQNFLYSFGYMTVAANGYFGPATEQAVVDFQKNNNITVRGYVGPNTRGAIASITCNGDTASIEKAMYVPPAPKPQNTNLQNNSIDRNSVEDNNSKTSNNNAIMDSGINNTDNNSSIFKKNTAKSNNNSLGDNVNIDSTINKSSTAQPKTTNLVSDYNNTDTRSNSDSTKTNTNTNTNTNTKVAKLSAENLSFSGKNTIHFNYNLDSGESISLCFENKKNTSCESAEYVKVVESLTGQMFDSVKIANKWSITVYNSEDWVNGGKIKIKSGTKLYNISVIK